MQVMPLEKVLSIQAHPDRDLEWAKKNGLNYLFQLHEQCSVFLLQV
jgi:mannose-6-phosphate isomerase class I